MDIFRYEDRVPLVYVQESRDFLILARLLTMGLDSAKNNSEQLKYLNSAKHVNNNLLPLLKTKVGFLTHKEFVDKLLRDVLKSFTHMTKNKGSIVGILQALYIYFDACNLYTDSIVQITHNDSTYPYEIRVAVKSGFKDFTLLEELLKFVIPAGYKLNIYFYSDESAIETYYLLDDVTWYSTEVDGDMTYATRLGRSGNTQYGRIDTLVLGNYKDINPEPKKIYTLKDDELVLYTQQDSEKSTLITKEYN